MGKCKYLSKNKKETRTMIYLIRIKIKDDYDIDTVVGEPLQSLLEAGMIESYEILAEKSTCQS